MAELCLILVTSPPCRGDANATLQWQSSVIEEPLSHHSGVVLLVHGPDIDDTSEHDNVGVYFNQLWGHEARIGNICGTGSAWFLFTAWIRCNLA